MKASACTATMTRLQPHFADMVLLFTRLTIGSAFILTGKGKLTHLAETTEFFASLGLPAPGFHAGFIGGLELVGGILLVAGLFTRLISIPLTATMIVAYLTAHRAEAFAGLTEFVSQAPFPYLLATLFLLAFGPGRLALGACCQRRT
jgi:putative oxidoreductase